MKTKRIINLIKFIAISGNVIFIFSILYDRLTELFAVTFDQFLGYMILAALLIINTFLVVKGADHANMNRSN
ncbi:hypothetical protein [Mucilaginibacter ginsenosidivorans]|uniref:Uncharacterized protein n=1 Tax=Mucilaginibacter ginsenosidivorans TaxID=398053 RepID=A0A5B8UWK3_9SPHI|nr:hypothetical protein [Mucilaginibacter ginsenosidivorans]QEC62691.1 hypothetical protein FRZ54_08860 [Mucilaginibacter ginsenosidivorans]